MAPWGIYPLPASDCAALICDLAFFETVISVDHLCREFEGRGLRCDVLLPDRAGVLEEGTPVLVVHSGPRAVSVHSGGFGSLLYELLDPEAWVDGIIEALQSATVPVSPVLLFADEAAAWSRGSQLPSS